MKLSNKYKIDRQRIKMRRQDTRRNRRHIKRRPKILATNHRLALERAQKRQLAVWEKNAAIYDILRSKERELDLPATARIVQKAASIYRKNIGKKKHKENT